MKHNTFIAAIVAVACATASGVALAKGGPHHGPKMSFEELDADGSGEVTQAELQAHKQARFASADANGDGLLSLDELQAQASAKAAERAARMLERFDKNGDGSLSEGEMPKPRDGARMFERMDRDGSGGISKQEFEEARMHRGGKHRHAPGADGTKTEQN
ncbi:EF-hand domain-containing protein [Nocardioides marinus]|jgi:hypothetical protein|nr:EF-hand domain-containing protein [Nocardioides marinus]